MYNDMTVKDETLVFKLTFTDLQNYDACNMINNI